MPDTHVPAVEYDSTVDECVDSTLRAVRRTKTHQRQRLKSRLAFGASFGFTMLVMIGLINHWTAFAIQAGSIAAVIAGLIMAALYGSIHDHSHARHVRAFFQERFKGVPTVKSRVELRPDALWLQSTNGDTSIPWKRVTDVVDAPNGVELWLDPMALCLVPSRAFATPADQRGFLEVARARASSDRS